MTETNWDTSFPEQGRLRTEVKAAADAQVDALLASIPRQDIAAIYVKGSSIKAWHSPIDYVPKLSDVDVHVLFSTDDASSRFCGTLAAALNLASLTEKLFHQRVAEPWHVPRIQLINANGLYGRENFIPSPASTVETRVGRAYPSQVPDMNQRRRSSRAGLLESQTFLDELPDRAVDRFGPYCRELLRQMSWRVAPAAPRVLDLIGAEFEMAWASNRTQLVDLLTGLGFPLFAAAYRQFYVSAWEYQLSNDRDTNAGSMALEAGAAVLAMSISLASAGE